MKSVRKKVTFSNVIACLALFIALGGVSWAAVKLPKNSVSTKQLKKNSVTTSKIKRSAVTGAKIKNNTISGADINESSVGKVPSATSADSLSYAVPLTIKRAAVAGSGGSEAAAQAAATEIPLISHGQISIYGKCFVDTSTDDVYVKVFARTSADGALLETDNDNLYGDPDYLNTGTLEDDRNALSTEAANNSADADGDTHSEIEALGPDGNGLFAYVHAFVKNGPNTNGNGAFGVEDGCIFFTKGEKATAG